MPSRGILTYFRDEERITACGHCDICVPTSDWVIARPARSLVSSFVPSFVSSSKVRKKSASPKELPGLLLGQEAELRASLLRDWRKKYASDKDIAAFIVFSNKNTD